MRRQLRSGEPSYLQVTIPDVHTWVEVIADFVTQTDTEMVIEADYRWSDGRFETQEIAFDLDQAWMAHHRTYHRPEDGSDIPTQTAVEGGVVPEFRR